MVLFNALTGTELIEVILTKIREKLEASGELKPHNTFPWSKVSFAIGVIAYPQQAQDAPDPKIKIVGSEVFGFGDPPENVPLELTIKGVEVFDTPDKTRVETKLPIPTPVPGPGGQLVDKPILRSPTHLKTGKEGVHGKH